MNNQQPPHRKLKGEFADYFLLLSNQPIILQATHLKPQLFPQKLIQKIKQFPVKKDTIIKQLNYPPMKTDKVEFENRDALEIIKLRYAKGEISKEEYQQLKSDLRN